MKQVSLLQLVNKGVLVLTMIGLPALAMGQSGPLYKGGYAAPMGAYLFTDDDRLDDGTAGILAFGYRADTYALELAVIKNRYDSPSRYEPEATGGALNALWFPSESLPNLYGIASFGAVSLANYPVPADDDGGLPMTGGSAMEDERFTLTRVGIGAGHLFEFKFGDYQFALRTEAKYVRGFRDDDVREPQGPTLAPNHFDDIVVGIGLQLPFGIARSGGEKAAGPAPKPGASASRSQQKDSQGNGDQSGASDSKAGEDDGGEAQDVLDALE